jgi:hydrogenase maturation protease
MTSVIAGVGYRNLADHSLGVLVTDDLAERSLPPGIEVHDLSYNPVAVAQWLESLDVGDRPERLVFLSAVERGRAPGTVTAYRWDGRLPDHDRIQRAVEDAVTGVIFLDNTLIVLGWFALLPPDVVVVEAEPAVEAFGDALSAAVAPCFSGMSELAVDLASSDGAVSRLPRRSLGGFVSSPSASS